jgi:hypothetical protein
LHRFSNTALCNVAFFSKLDLSEHFSSRWLHLF